MSQINYVIGIGRSGTSLLMSLLGSHNKIHTPPENYFCSFFMYKYRYKKVFSPFDIAQINRFFNSFHELQPIVGFKYIFPEDIAKNGFQGTYKELCELLYKSYIQTSFPDKNAEIIIDKNPSNTLFLNRINSFNPEAKYILMLRDYRANVLSRKQSVHLLPPSILFNSIRWKLFTSLALNFIKKHKDKVLIVRYEDLVLSTEETLKKIHGFLGVEFEYSEGNQKIERESYLEYKKNKETSEFKRTQKKYDDLARPIFKDRLDNWKTDLTDKEIDISQNICSNIGIQFGYMNVKNVRKLNIVEKIAWLNKSIRIKSLYIKDQITFISPLELKIKRFEKFVIKSINKRNKYK